MKSQTGTVTLGSATDSAVLPANPRRTALLISAQLETTTAGSVLVDFGHSASSGVAVASNTSSGAIVHPAANLTLDNAGDMIRLPIHLYWTGTGNKMVSWLECFE